MKELAFTLIADTAETAGLDRASVMDRPEKETVLLPVPRVQVEYMPETITRSGRLIGRQTVDIDVPAADPEDPPVSHPHQVVRRAIYNRALDVAAEVISDDPEWAEEFVAAFLRALPRRMADAESNLVKVEAFRAVRGGYEGRMVEVFVRRRVTIHVRLTGMIHVDTAVPHITGMDITVNAAG